MDISKLPAVKPRSATAWGLFSAISGRCLEVLGTRRECRRARRGWRGEGYTRFTICRVAIAPQRKPSP